MLKFSLVPIQLSVDWKTYCFLSGSWLSLPTPLLFSLLGRMTRGTPPKFPGSS